MVVGLCVIEIYIPSADSLKSKRGILKSLIQRVRNKFNVSICELEKHDVWKSAVIGLASISGDREVLDRTFAAVEKFLDSNGSIQIVDFRVEMI